MTKTIIPNKGDSPFAAAVKAGDFIFTSGTLGHVDAQGNPVEGLEAQARQCLENIKLVLQKAGASLSDVIKTTVFLTDSGDFAKMNEVYLSYFPKDRPVRSTITVGLANPKMLIEIECIAYKA